MEQLERAGGRFGRHAGVRQAIRDLHNPLSRLHADRSARADDRETRRELEPAYRKLLAECDRIIAGVAP